VVHKVAKLRDVDLPDFGMPDITVELPPALYADRFERFRASFVERGLDHVVVYADREHSANLSFLTGFDPRFEEALLIAEADGPPTILVGNECVGMARAAPLPMAVQLYQTLSLPNQPNERSPSLETLLRECRIDAGSEVGVVGWKALPSRSMLDAPAFIVDVGPSGEVENATDILIDPQDGLRIINDVDQLAAFEFAACQTSAGVRRILAELEPGVTERDAVALLDWDGSPLSCHLMLTAGDRARLGLLSPGSRVIRRGDPFTVAFGIWGALTCRAGFVVEDAAELPRSIGDYVERLVAPYYAAIAEWYAALHIGQKGRVLQAIIDRRLGDPFFGIFLNPGHQIHLDEWVNSPVGPDSDVELRSGMAMQVDVIPATGTPYFTTNIEDGIAFADASLRREIAARHPAMWDRTQLRRRFMQETLGIDLDEDVLPFSNMPAYLQPFILGRGRAMAMV
jgi:hypothetical protein